MGCGDGINRFISGFGRYEEDASVSRKALEDIRAMGIEEGEALGEVRGEARGKAQSIIEFAKELDWSTEQILQRLQDKLHISPEEAKEYLNRYQ